MGVIDLVQLKLYMESIIESCKYIDTTYEIEEAMDIERIASTINDNLIAMGYGE